MHVYHDMIREVLKYGTRKENRTGVDTLSTFNYNYEIAWPGMFPADADGTPHEPLETQILEASEGPGWALPLLTTKKISWKNIVVEMLWFLSGRDDIEILKRHKCKFWDPWAASGGRVPSAYGNFWRRFPVHGIRDSSDMNVDGDPCLSYNDQLKWVMNEIRQKPMSRRQVVSAWYPENAQYSKLPPCHLLYLFNVQNVPCRACDGDGWVSKHGYSGPERDGCPNNCQGKPEQRLCLHLTQRSCDLALGVPYNMASYGLLLLIMSHLTGIKPGIFAHTLADLHIYTRKPADVPPEDSMVEYDHVPGLKEQLGRKPGLLPRLIIDPSIKELSDIEALMKPEVTTEQILEIFRLEGYEPHPAINFKVAV